MTTPSPEMRGPLKTHRELADKEFRDSVVDVEVRRGVPVQIREMREAKGWSQEQLGQLIGKPQNNISRMENTRETYLSIKTLLQIASVFDVGLLVRFVPFSEIARWTDNHSIGTVVPKDYDNEIADEIAAEQEVLARAAQERAAGVSRIEDYWANLATGQRRPAHKVRSGGMHGLDRDPKGSSADLFPSGETESPSQGR